MMPGRSALTVTPFTASTVPIAFRVVDHVSCFATTVVTASGGGAQLCDIAALIWKYLNPPIAPTNTTTPASISNMRFFITKAEMYNVRPPRGVKKMWRPRVGAFTGLRTVERAFTARAPRACRCRSGASPARGGCRYAPMWEGDDRVRPRGGRRLNAIRNDANLRKRDDTPAVGLRRRQHRGRVVVTRRWPVGQVGGPVARAASVQG